MSDTLEKISKLLLLAEKSTNEHEADAYMKKAQEIATLSAIDVEVARAHGHAKTRVAQLEQRRVVIGERGKKGLYTFVELFLQIAHQNNVRCTIATKSDWVNAFGFDTDIDVVEALYSSLVIQMVQASDAYIKSGVYKEEKSRRWSEKEWAYVNRPVDGRTARASFQKAFARKIGDRLWRARLDAEEQAKAADPHFDQVGDVQQESTLSDSVALVLKRKEKVANEFYAEATKKIRGHWGGGRGASYSSAASGAGSRAGAQARISAGKAIGGSRTALS